MPYREDIPGSMGLHDFLAIEALSASIPSDGNVVEVGSYFGRSAWAWAKSVAPSVKVYCIDPWLGKLKEKETPLPGMMQGPTLEDFKNNLKDCPNVIPIQGFSPEMPWDKSLKPDLVFIDGNHLAPYVDRDIEFWNEQLKPDGILCGHDFRPFDWPDVCEAVIRHSKKLKKPFRIFEKSSIWYIEKGNKQWNKANRETFANRIFLEDMSWQPNEQEIEKIRTLYNKDVLNFLQ